MLSDSDDLMIDGLPEAWLEFSNVCFGRGERRLFGELSFRLDSGQLLWVTGENGIGKTSILKLALGIWRPVSGTIKHTLSGVTCDANRVVAYLGHIDAFDPLLTAQESLEFWAEIYGFDQSLSDVFLKIGLEEQQALRTKVLSAGQKRRLAFARLLIAERPIWVLDEPSAALDERGQHLIEELISEHLTRGGSALIATHDETSPLGRKASRISLRAAS